jgi:hypothetical protein
VEFVALVCAGCSARLEFPGLHAAFALPLDACFQVGSPARLTRFFAGLQVATVSRLSAAGLQFALLTASGAAALGGVDPGSLKAGFASLLTIPPVAAVARECPAGSGRFFFDACCATLLRGTISAIFAVRLYASIAGLLVAKVVPLPGRISSTRSGCSHTQIYIIWVRQSAERCRSAACIAPQDRFPT